MTDDIINIILFAMLQNEGDLALQEINCKTLANLSVDRRVCDLINDIGGTDIVTKALAVFPRSQNLTVDCLCYLENVARTPDKG